MSSNRSTFSRRTLVRAGITVPLTAAAVGAVGMGVAMADGRPAPDGGDTAIADKDLDQAESTVIDSSAPENPQLKGTKARVVKGFTTMAAASWNGENPEVVEFQAVRHDGSVSDWINAELLTDDGAKATDAVWFGPSTAVHVRASRGGADVTKELRLHTIATSAASKDKRMTSGPAGSGLFRPLVPTTIQPGTQSPAVISRAEWGADESLTGNVSSTSTFRSVIIHHTAGSNSYTASESAQIMRGILSYHAGTLGWADVGYNVIVDKYGQIFEGRKGGLERNIIGAHCYQFNTGSFGISVMGNYDSRNVPSAGLEAVAQMAAWKLQGTFANSVYDPAVYPNIPASDRVKKSGNVEMPKLFGHRDANYTSCPGAYFYGQFGTLRTRVAGLMANKNQAHKNAFNAAGGAAALGSVSQIQKAEGAYQVTRLSQGLVITASGVTRAYQSIFASRWLPSWGLPLESTLNSAQSFQNGIATRINGVTSFTFKKPYQIFSDVYDAHQFATEINTLARKGIVRGWPDGTFRPSINVARDAVITYMYRMSGSPAFTPPRVSPFVDVSPSHSFYKEITWAYARGITTGWVVNGRREFRPLLSINRDAMAVFLARYAGAQLTRPLTDPFVDVPKESAFAPHIQWFKDQGLTTGWSDGTFRPLTPTQRKDMAAFMYRLLKAQGRL